METLLFDPALAETRVLFGMAEAEVAQRGQWRSSATLYRAIDETLAEAAAHPDIFVDEQMLRGDATEMAVRAAVADLAVRLSLGEGTVRDYAHVARMLRQRAPRVWAWFADGEVSTQNAREVAAIAGELSQQFWAPFDEHVVDAARSLAPARFRAKARGIRERLQASTTTERHESGMVQRRVWKDHDSDGMAWLGAYLPAASLEQAMARIDELAFGLFTDAEETRTMAQLRADVLTDLLLGANANGRVGISLALTIPIMTLLGHSDEPAILQGAGPIDLGTARRLAAESPSITRLLTDPVTREVLQLDPNQYRMTAALKRWFTARHELCDHPGCGRPASQSDLDHTVARAANGQTTVENLAPRCRPHHRLKHETKWRVETPPGSSRPVWTSPTGHRRETDPPPF